MAKRKTRQATSTAKRDEGRLKSFVALATSGPNGVLIAIAILLEAIILGWLAKATDSHERIFAGGFAVLILLCLVVALVVLEMLRARPGSAVVGPEVAGLDQQSVPVSAIAQAAKAPAPEASPGEQIRREPIVGADRSFIIDRPPERWSVRTTSLDLEIRRQFGTSLGDTDRAFQTSSMLVLELGHSIDVEPIPGKTTVNGTQVPILLTQTICRKLSIVSYPRRQPPFFSERSLYDNFLTLSFPLLGGQTATMGSLSSGKLPRTNRDMVQAQIVQEFGHIRVSNQVVEMLRLDIRVTAVRGDLFDYIISIVNIRGSDEDDSQADQMDRDVGTLFESFHIAASDDPKAEARSQSAKAARGNQESIAALGPMIFVENFGVAVDRLKGIDHRSPQGIGQCLSVLRPFRIFAADLDPKAIPNLSEVWRAMDKAEGGDTGRLCQLLDELKAEPAQLPPALEGQAEPRALPSS